MPQARPHDASAAPCEACCYARSTWVSAPLSSLLGRFARLRALPFSLSAATGLAAENLVRGSDLEEITATPVQALAKTLRVYFVVKIII